MKCVNNLPSDRFLRTAAHDPYENCNPQWYHEVSNLDFPNPQWYS